MAGLCVIEGDARSARHLQMTRGKAVEIAKLLQSEQRAKDLKKIEPLQLFEFPDAFDKRCEPLVRRVRECFIRKVGQTGQIGCGSSSPLHARPKTLSFLFPRQAVKTGAAYPVYQC